MTAGISTFGFDGDGSSIAALGFGDAPTGTGPAGATNEIVTFGFGGDGSTIAALGFGGEAAILPTGPLTLREAVYARLMSTPTITGLVGPRVYFGNLPQTANLNAGPAIVYQVVSRGYGHVLAGADGMSQARVQISVHSISQATSDYLMDQVRQRFDGFRGFIDGFEITVAVLENEIDLPYAPVPGTDQWYYEISADYQINHRVPLPALLNDTERRHV